jgi:hypothetical protein
MHLVDDLVLGVRQRGEVRVRRAPRPRARPRVPLDEDVLVDPRPGLGQRRAAGPSNGTRCSCLNMAGYCPITGGYLVQNDWKAAMYDDVADD